MRRILVATDGSSDAERAVDFAAALAKDTGSAFFIVTVGSDVSSPDVQALARAEGGLGEALELLSNQILEKARHRAQRKGLAQMDSHVAWGDPAASILEAAQAVKADIIVVGRRGRGRLTGLLLGSVSQKLVSLAPCPVIVVP